MGFKELKEWSAGKITIPLLHFNKAIKWLYSVIHKNMIEKNCLVLYIMDLFLSGKLSIPELAHVRYYLEPEIARLAAIHSSDTDKKRLTEAQGVEFGEWNTYMERVIHFQKIHMILAEICGNHFFEAISKSMLKLTREIVEAVEPDHERLHQPGEHGDIIKAVITGEPNTAQLAMKRHLDKFCANLIKMEEAYRKKSVKR